MKIAAICVTQEQRRGRCSFAPMGCLMKVSPLASHYVEPLLHCHWGAFLK